MALIYGGSIRAGVPINKRICVTAGGIPSAPISYVQFSGIVWKSQWKKGENDDIIMKVKDEDFLWRSFCKIQESDSAIWG